MAESNYNWKKTEKKLGKYLDSDRMLHTQGVMYTAACLAMVHGCSVQQAQLAGLLHDCAKQIPEHKMLRMCAKHNVTVSSYESRHPFILHAKLGAVLARKKYGVNDQEVLDAISWHTTGKIAMTDLEKIVYIADYIEPGRKKAPNLDVIRKEAFRSLNKAMYYILSDTLQYLKRSGKEIDAATESAYEFYCNLHNQE